MERKAELSWSAGKQSWGCTASVFQSGAYRSSRCNNRAKYDPDADGNPTKCGIHCEAAEAKRRAKSDAKLANYLARMDRQATLRALNAEATQIIRRIAEGHNDPRSLALDWVRRKDAAQEDA